MAMTQAERDAEDAKWILQQIAEAPSRLRKENEFNPVTVEGITITPIDKTLTRLYAVIVGANGAVGWRADNGVFDLTHAQALALYQAGQASIAKAFAAQAAIEGNTYNTLEEVEAAYATAYNQA